MAAVKFSGVAESDIKRIEKMYGPVSDSYKTFSIDVAEHCRDYLGPNPRLGKKVPTRDINYFRQILYRRVWRIIYTYDDVLDLVEIHNVIHTSKQF